MISTKRYPEDLRQEAVSEVENRRLSNPHDRTIFRQVAEKYNVGEQSLRLWIKKRDENRMGGTDERETSDLETKLPFHEPMSEEQIIAEFERMRLKIKRLQTENEALKRAFVVFSSEWAK